MLKTRRERRARCQRFILDFLGFLFLKQPQKGIFYDRLSGCSVLAVSAVAAARALDTKVLTICAHDLTYTNLRLGTVGIIKKRIPQSNSILFTRSYINVPVPKSCIYLKVFGNVFFEQTSQFADPTEQSSSTSCTRPIAYFLTLNPDASSTRTHRALNTQMLQIGNSSYFLACLLLLLATHCSNTHAFLLSYPSSSTTAVPRARTTTSNIIANRMSASSSPSSSNVEGMQQVLFVEVRMRLRHSSFIS